MANLLTRWRGSRDIQSLDDYAQAVSAFQFQGNTYGLGQNPVQNTWGTEVMERVGPDLAGFGRAAYADNGVIFACMAVRQLVFSAVEFKWQRLGGGPTDLFGSPDLALFERPWVGGTTQDLLARMEQDVSLAGNSMWTVDAGSLVRLRPDWTDIVMEPREIRGRQVGWKRIGYAYWEDGNRSTSAEPAVFTVDEVAHYAPHPDPLATFRGMSWLTPLAREIGVDKLMTRHQQKFFEQGATPNVIIRMEPGTTPEQFERFKRANEVTHRGVDNAYRTMYVAQAADITVAGLDFERMSFKTIRGHGETRIAAAAQVPPVIVGLSEGLQAATYSNYAQARRRFADGTMHPYWRNAAGSMSILSVPPRNSRLWYDARNVPFLREDEKDAAEIQQTEAQTIRSLIDAGYEPASVVAAVNASDWSMLQHTGLYSVQLQPPGTGQPQIDAPAS